MKKNILYLITTITIGLQSAYASPDALATTAAQQESSGGVYLVLFLITLAILIAGAIGFFVFWNKNKEAEVIKEEELRKGFRIQLDEMQEKLQNCQAQGRNIHQKLKQSIAMNGNIKTKFQSVYDELVEKYKKIQGSFKNLKEESGFQAELEKVHTKLEDAQAMVLHAEKMSSLGQLTAGIAHEINNPVNFVSNGINTLKESFEQLHVFIENYRRICELGSIEEVKKYYSILREDDKEYNSIKQIMEESMEDMDYGTTRITEIVNGLRIFSRQDELDIKESHIHDIIDNALLILKPKYKKKAKVLKDFHHDMPTIKCLPGQLNQALVNLIGNASDAIDFKGTITIRTADLGPDSIEVQIQDDGKGIPEDVKSKIFDPFYTTKPVGKGTGLGLSITYGIIEKHGGTIKVDSEVGKGTVFTVVLPKKIKLKKNNN